MSFRLFGVNVEIQMGFWINALLIGFVSTGGGSNIPLLALWVVIVLVSILVHEFGHALAILRHGIEPEIALHWMGGSTTWQQTLPLSRPQRVLISVAGPVAGFVLAALVFGFMSFFPNTYHRLPSLAIQAFRLLVYVNLFWGVFNLIPVLPLDGGHILEHALGPKRVRLTALISLIIAVGCGAVFLFIQAYFAAFIFALSAFQSYQRLRSEEPEGELAPRRPMPAQEPWVPQELAVKLRSAKRALAEDDYALAASLANDVLRTVDQSPEPSVRARLEAYEILAWCEQMRGDLAAAARWIKVAQQHGTPDAALLAAVLIGRGDMKEARKVLEQARATGDERKEILGPLIQILIAAGEVARASAVAFDIIESLSDEDARKMAEIAADARSHDWAGRLYEAVFARSGAPDDAYEAARAYAADGAQDRALDLLGRAVSAGFSDRARAWSDAALEPLRAGRKLETVVPRP